MVTSRKGLRFSLISLADHKATVTTQVVPALRPESVSSLEISGLHVVCAECDGFVLRNGVLKSCRHQRDSWSSVSESRRDGSKEVVGDSGARTTGDVGGRVQMPASGSRLEVDGSRMYKEVALVWRKDTTADQERRLVKLKMRQRGPAVLRSGQGFDGRVQGAKGRDHEAGRRSGSVIENSSSSTMVAARDGSDAAFRAGDAARGKRHRGKKETQLNSGGDEDRTTENGFSVDSDSVDQSQCDSEALMQGWREWSERWERSVRSR